MHLYTILAFAILFWQAEEPGRWLLVSSEDSLWTLFAVGIQLPVLAIAGSWAAHRAQGLFVTQPDAPQVAQLFHHRATLCLRTALFGGYAGSVMLTGWPEFFSFGKIHPALQLVGDLMVLSPFFLGATVLWLTAYPLEKTLRTQSLDWPGGEQVPGRRTWGLFRYLDFNLRHHLLIVAIPMTLIMFAADLTRGYKSELRSWSGWSWTPDLMLGLFAAGMFVVAPVILIRIWRTAPLEPGPLRERLEATCGRIGLRCREILVWKSDGIMINAAVMGMFAPVRYVLLSDALLDTMDTRQIEAVFGHEAGHIRHRHIQHFLIFALLGWLVVAGVMEILTAIASEPNPTLAISTNTIQGIGLVATVLYWGVGFGWLSRRFERQADLFGARCVTPAASECRLPCGVHPDAQRTVATLGRVCSTGAAVFSSALDRVAMLNGIPHEERSWRHSSIGSRIRFLTSMAGDPGLAMRFERMIRRVKLAVFVLVTIGSLLAAYYWIAIVNHG